MAIYRFFQQGREHPHPSKPILVYKRKFFRINFEIELILIESFKAICDLGYSRSAEELMAVSPIKKKCPQCNAKAVRLYQNKTVEGKRKWVPIAWCCTDCNFLYTVASNTLMYPIGGKEYNISYDGKCPNCDLKLTRLFRHKNPVHGKQEWLSTAWYCARCKYVWLDNPE